MNKRLYCNQCGNKDFSVLYKLGNFHVMKCNSCSLVFRDIILNDDEIKHLYSKNYFIQEQKDYFFNKSDLKEKIFQNRLNDIEKIYPGKGKILDFGCAIGTFLYLAKKSGWDVKGIEVSEYAANYARENYQLDVAIGELNAQNFIRNSFDVVTLWDTIDHAEEPQDLLKNLYLLCRPGGLLVVQTNMEDSLLYKIAHYLYKSSFGLIKRPVARCHPIHHSTFYSSKTLKTALEKAGFKIIRARADDLAPDLINTNKINKKILKIISFLSLIFNRPHEIIFYAEK